MQDSKVCLRTIRLNEPEIVFKRATIVTKSLAIPSSLKNFKIFLKYYLSSCEKLQLKLTHENQTQIKVNDFSKEPFIIPNLRNDIYQINIVHIK